MGLFLLYTDRRSAAHAPPYENFRRRPRDDSQVRRGSLDRGRTGYEKRRSWSPDDYGSSLDTFSPVTLTVSSFFKQVSRHVPFTFYKEIDNFFFFFFLLSVKSCFSLVSMKFYL